MRMFSHIHKCASCNKTIFLETRLKNSKYQNKHVPQVLHIDYRLTQTTIQTGSQTVYWFVG
jgi:hypothetical protein